MLPQHLPEEPAINIAGRNQRRIYSDRPAFVVYNISAFAG
jgi:hypothetical protein